MGRARRGSKEYRSESCRPRAFHRDNLPGCTGGGLAQNSAFACKCNRPSQIRHVWVLPAARLLAAREHSAILCHNCKWYLDVLQRGGSACGEASLRSLFCVHSRRVRSLVQAQIPPETYQKANLLECV